MKWIILAAKKCPKWLISGGIISVSSVVFVGWWAMRKPAATGEPQLQTSRETLKEPDAVDIKFDDTVLVGNCLIDFRAEKILTKQWLEGFDNSLPPLTGTFPDDKLVVAARGGMAIAYGFDGKAKPPLSVDGKAVGAAAFSPSSPDVIYIREGNLWRGKVDWLNSTLSEPKRITDTGFFRDDTFRGEWFWTGDNLFLSILGRSHVVSLSDGKITPDQPPVAFFARGGSPDHKLAALMLGLGEFGVIEFEKSDLKHFRTVGEVKQVVWLTPTRVAVLGGYRRISIYDHEKGEVTGNFELKGQIQTIASNSPDGKYLLLGTGGGPKFLNVDTGEFTPVTHPMAFGAWLSNDTLLCSNSLTDSELRGVWVCKMDGTKERISNQPIDSSAAAGNSEPLVEVKGGVVFVSSGDLWFYASSTKALRRVTQGQKLTPNIKSLALK